jgi:hypothetical protein
MARVGLAIRRRAVVATVLAAALFAGAVLAGAPADFGLRWWSVDGGGGTSTGAGYSVSGAVGQPDAAVATGGDYAVRGGFWVGGVSPPAATVTPTATAETTATSEPTVTATSTGSPAPTNTATPTSTGSPPPSNTPTATGTATPTTTVTPEAWLYLPLVRRSD